MEKKPIKKKCWCGNAFGQCHQPIEEKWKESLNSLLFKSIDLKSEILSFITTAVVKREKEIADEVEKIKTYTGGSSVNEKDKRVNKAEVLSILKH